MAFFLTTALYGQNLKLDTTTLPKPKFFELAFLNDSTIELPFAGEKFYVKEYDKINIKTGKIVLSDFEGIGKTHSFTQNFPKGSYPFQLSVAVDEYHSFLAYARILFSDNPVMKWEYALRPGERRKSFTDRIFDTCLWRESDYAMYVVGDSSSHKYLKQKKGINNTTDVNQFKLDKFDFTFRTLVLKYRNHSLFALSGNYSGCYAAYIGYDKEGKICRLLIDPGNYSLNPSSFE